LSRRKGVAKAPRIGLVLDCSIVMAWHFADEADSYADRVARDLAKGAAIVPAIWPLEVANVLAIGERRGRSTPAQAARLLRSLAALPIAVDPDTNRHAWESTLALARARGLSAYDAAYLDLALRRGLPLATLDDRLRAAAIAAGVEPFGLA
jgi:predicted nucleic acid-binding protein